MPRGRPHKCPYDGCGSTTTVSKGARITKSMGVRKIRLCKSCGRKFTPKNQKPEQVEEIKTEAAQNDVAAVVAPEDTVTVDDQESEMSGMQLSEQ
jgi:hypothetical protein